MNEDAGVFAKVITVAKSHGYKAVLLQQLANDLHGFAKLMYDV